MRIRNSLAILCSTVFCCSLVLTGCNKSGGKSTSGSIPEGYYEVTFETRGGTEIAPQVVKSGEKATKPANDPTNAGSKFTGWYKDFDAVTLFDFEDPITAPTTIYAGWDLDWNSFYGGQGTSEGGGGGGGDETTIYCKMEYSWWTTDGAAVGIYCWNGADKNANWPGQRMTPVSGHTNVWSFNIDTSKYHEVIFTRVNGSGDVADWGAKTKDLTFPTDGRNFFTITNSSAVWGDPGCDGTWSTFNA